MVNVLSSGVSILVGDRPGKGRSKKVTNNSFLGNYTRQANHTVINWLVDHTVLTTLSSISITSFF